MTTWTGGRAGTAGELIPDLTRGLGAPAPSVQLPSLPERSFVMRRAMFASILLSFFLAGCQGGDPMTSGQFTSSTTAPAPGLVKLVRKSASNERVVVDALI